MKLSLECRVAPVKQTERLTLQCWVNEAFGGVSERALLPLLAGRVGPCGWKSSSRRDLGFADSHYHSYYFVLYFGEQQAIVLGVITQFHIPFSHCV